MPISSKNDLSVRHSTRSADPSSAAGQGGKTSDEIPPPGGLSRNQRKKLKAAQARSRTDVPKPIQEVEKPVSLSPTEIGGKQPARKMQAPSFLDENPAQYNREHLEFILNKTTGLTSYDMGVQFLKDVLSASVSIAAGVAATSISNRIESARQPDLGIDKSSGRPSPGAQLIGTSLSTMIYPHISRIIESLAANISPFNHNDIGKCKAVVNEVMGESRHLLSQLSKTVQDSVKRLDDENMESLNALSEGRTPLAEPRTINEIYERLYVRQCYWLGQPRVFKNYMKTTDMEMRDAIINGQPAEGREETADIFRTLLASSFRGAFGPARLQYLFSGPPGVGKTTLLQDIASATGAPLILLDYEDLEPEDISGVGRRRDIAPPKLPGEPVRLSMKGRLRDQVRETGIKNPLVGFDEFSTKDHSANMWKLPLLRKLLNKEKLTTAPPGEEDLSAVSFFILTNDEKIDPALRSRLLEKLFPPLDGETIEKALDNQISAFIGQYEKENASSIANDHESMIEKKFIENVIGKTHELVGRYKPRMLKNNIDPGGRTIKLVASQAIDFVFTEIYLARDANYAVPEDKLRDIIDRYSCAVDGKLVE